LQGHVDDEVKALEYFRHLDFSGLVLRLGFRIQTFVESYEELMQDFAPSHEKILRRIAFCPD